MRRRLLSVLALSVVLVAAFASAADAAALDRAPRNDRRIGISGGVVVAEGEVVDGPVVSADGAAVIDGTVTEGVFVGNGRVTIRGRVDGDVLVVSGNVVISGRVGGDVIALDGRITTRDGAQVNGDVTSRHEPNVAPGTVRGDVKTLNAGNLFAGFVVALLVLLWIAVTLSVAIFGLVFVLVFPRAADATAEAGRRFWRTVGWGALVGIAGPILAVVLITTVVGIPLGLGILSGLNVLAPLGYVASSLVLGRLIVRGTSTGARIGAFFAGFGILRVAALIPGIGFVVWFLVATYGIGALTQAAWRAGRVRPDVADADDASPAPAAPDALDDGRAPGTAPAHVPASAPDAGPANAPEGDPGSTPEGTSDPPRPPAAGTTTS